MSWDEPNSLWATRADGEGTPLIPVITAVVGADEAAIAHELSTLVGHVLVRRCVDVAELLGAVHAGIGAIAIVSSEQPGFDRELIATLQSEGVVLLALNDPEDQYSLDRMNSMGVKHAVSSSRISSDLVDALTACTQQLESLAVQSVVTTRKPSRTESDTQEEDPAASHAIAEMELTLRREDIADLRSYLSQHGYIDHGTADAQAEGDSERDGTIPAPVGGAASVLNLDDSLFSHESLGRLQQAALNDATAPNLSLLSSQSHDVPADVGVDSTELQGFVEGLPGTESVSPDSRAADSDLWSPRSPASGPPSVHSLSSSSLESGEAPHELPGATPRIGGGRSRGAEGRVVAVWSGHGAPGRSTLAAGMAMAFAQGDGSVGATEGQSDASAKASKARFWIGGKASGKKPSAAATAALKESSGASVARQAPTPSDGTAAHSSADPGTQGAPHSTTSTMLVDADTYAPSQAQALGLLEESSGLARACRSANQGLLSSHTLAEAAVSVSDQLALLTGLPKTSRWTEIASHSFDAVIAQSRKDYAWTVIDCAPPIEQDEMLSFDTRAPQRNAATLTTLQAADLVVIVGKADPIGMKRLISAIVEFKESDFASTPMVVVVNHAPTRVTGKERRTQIKKALRRFAGEDAPVFIPFEPKRAHGALEIGKAVNEGRSKSDLPAALESLAAMISAGFVSQSKA